MMRLKSENIKRKICHFGGISFRVNPGMMIQLNLMINLNRPQKFLNMVNISLIQVIRIPIGPIESNRQRLQRSRPKICTQLRRRNFGGANIKLYILQLILIKFLLQNIQHIINQPNHKAGFKFQRNNQLLVSIKMLISWLKSRCRVFITI